MMIRVRTNNASKKNVLVIGAGEAGNAIIREIIHSSYLDMNVVGIIDDDKNKRCKSIAYLSSVIMLCELSAFIQSPNL